ncbi:MAG: DUF3859 domain-containing protein, partial [Planctomycetota bacterium]
MAKKLRCTMKSFGLYEAFDRDSDDLPRFLKRTVKVPARVDVEFGYILHITGGKGKTLDFVIDHPPFIDAKTGELSPPFTGQVFIDSNNYRFFLGDTVWLPVEDKTGPWRLITECDG